MTWMNPVMLPNTPAQAPAPPVAAAPQPTTGNPKNKFQWKAPTRGWHNGVPPGMQVPPGIPVPQGPPPSAPTLPEKRPAAPASTSSQPRPRREEYERNCMGQSFNIDDWLCGAAAMCTQRPGAPSPATDIPVLGPLGTTPQQGVLHVQAAKVGCGGDGGCLASRTNASSSSAPLLATQPSPTLDNDTLDELMLVEEDEEKGGLWKLVTDLFQMPAGWGDEGLQQRDPRHPTAAGPSNATLPPQPPTVMPYPPPQQLPATLGQPGPVLPPMQQPPLPPVASHGGQFSPTFQSSPSPFQNTPPFTFGAPVTPTSPPEDSDAFLDRVLTGVEQRSELYANDQPPSLDAPPQWELRQPSSSAGTSPSFSTNGFSSSGDLTSHETGNDHGSPRARVDSIDGTIDMDTIEVRLPLYLARRQPARPLSASPRPWLHTLHMRAVLLHAPPLTAPFPLRSPPAGDDAL